MRLLALLAHDVTYVQIFTYVNVCTSSQWRSSRAGLRAVRTGANKSLSKFTRGFDKEDIVAPYTARALASYTIDLMYKRLRT